jgi:heat shock protein HslJ
VLAVFKEQSQELKGTLWKIVRYSDGQGGLADVLSKGKPLTMTFGAGGRLNGSGGCNSYFANYTYVPSGRSFSFEMIIMTTIQCGSDEIMEQEGNVMAALYAAAAYRVENNVLTLQDADGNTVVLLQKQ